MALHLVYDLHIMRQMTDRRAKDPLAPNPWEPVYGYIHVINEVKRRYRAGDRVATFVTCYDWIVLGAFIVLVGLSVLGKAPPLP